jgi:hypothetical protein
VANCRKQPDHTFLKELLVRNPAPDPEVARLRGDGGQERVHQAAAGLDIPGLGRDHEIALLSGREAYRNSHDASPAWADGLPTVAPCPGLSE